MQYMCKKSFLSLFPHSLPLFTLRPRGTWSLPNTPFRARSPAIGKFWKLIRQKLVSVRLGWKWLWLSIRFSARVSRITPCWLGVCSTHTHSHSFTMVTRGGPCFGGFVALMYSEAVVLPRVFHRKRLLHEGSRDVNSNFLDQFIAQTNFRGFYRFRWGESLTFWNKINRNRGGVSQAKFKIMCLLWT